MISLGIESTTIQTVTETIFSHHIEVILNFHIHNVKRISHISQNNRNSIPKHQRPTNQLQSTEETHLNPSSIDKTENLEIL